jgi:hypothetical protein
LRTRKWQNTEGVERFSTEIIVDNFIFLDSKGGVDLESSHESLDVHHDLSPEDEEVPFYWYTIVYYEDDIQEFIEVLEECLDNNDKLKLIKIWKDNFYKEKFVVYKKLKESNQFLFEKQTFKMISCFL